MKGRAAALLALLAFIAIAVAAGVSLFRGGVHRDSVSGLVGEAAPAYALPPLAGEGAATQPDRFAGRAYVVNFFASWCAPCRVEHPFVQALAQSGAPILGVAYKDRPAAAQAYLAELGDPYAATGLDENGAVGLDFGITGVPETFVVGPDGRIRLHVRGPLDTQIIENKIRPALTAP